MNEAFFTQPTDWKRGAGWSNGSFGPFSVEEQRLLSIQTERRLQKEALGGEEMIFLLLAPQEVSINIVVSKME